MGVPGILAHTHTHMDRHMCTYIHTLACIHTYIHIHTHPYIYVYIYIYIYTRTSTHKRAHTHTCILIHPNASVLLSK